MAETTPLDTQLTRRNNADFGITADVDNIGSLRVVPDLVTRDNIPSSHLKIGMRVVVQDNGVDTLPILYRLAQISPSVIWVEGQAVVQEFDTFASFPDPATVLGQLAFAIDTHDLYLADSDSVSWVLATGGDTLRQSYLNNAFTILGDGNTIPLDATNLGIFIKDNFTPISGPMLRLTDDADAIDYLTVDTVNGTTIDNASAINIGGPLAIAINVGTENDAEIIVGNNGADTLRIRSGMVRIDNYIISDLIFKPVSNYDIFIDTAAVNTNGNILSVFGGDGGASDGSAPAGEGGNFNGIGGKGGAGMGVFGGGVGKKARIQGGNGGAGAAFPGTGPGGDGGRAVSDGGFGGASPQGGAIASGRGGDVAGIPGNAGDPGPLGVGNDGGDWHGTVGLGTGTAGFNGSIYLGSTLTAEPAPKEIHIGTAATPLTFHSGGTFDDGGTASFVELGDGTTTPFSSVGGLRLRNNAGVFEQSYSTGPWTPVAGAGGSIGGVNTNVQFNDSGVFGGDSDFTWNKTANVLTVTGAIVADSLDAPAALDIGTATTTQINLGYGGIKVLPGSGNVEIGDDASPFFRIRATTVVSGDLHLQDEQRGAHWVLREEPDGITAINKITGKRYSLNMKEI